MRVLALIAALAMVVAGCAEESVPQEEDDDFEDVEVDENTGGIRGVVVDDAIVPVEGATVRLTGEARETETDEEGRFSFSRLDPGTYFVNITKFLHESVQISVAVEAGVPDPPVVRVQLSRLFDQDPFLTAKQFKGHFGCAYNFGISSTCVNDYTRINPTGHCPGGCFPELASLIDNREYITQVEANWQTIQVELVWEPSLVGTSDTMGMTVSYSERPTATHYWFSGSGSSPLTARLDLGVSHSSENIPADSLEAIPPEGLEDLFIFMSAGESQISFEQEFEIFHHESYNAPLPEDWSFVEGDDPPF